ncbi:MAG TPA: hypothetical protein VMU19_07275 [Bryobacteraceae bacterium]|nr:hypothetical protein [Bryobacteraceae bacterium]
MYEQPKLNHVGKAEDVILGVWPGGDDLDGNFVFNCMKFAEEEETDRPKSER